jgi:hypothetical protein
MILQSISHRAQCWDSALFLVESFLGTIKQKDGINPWPLAIKVN